MSPGGVTFEHNNQNLKKISFSGCVLPLVLPDPRSYTDASVLHLAIGTVRLLCIYQHDTHWRNSTELWMDWPKKFPDYAC